MLKTVVTRGCAMCGRFTLRTPATALFDYIPSGLPPRYNIAPTQSVWIIRAAGQAPEAVEMHFGIAGAYGPQINSRSEKVSRLPAYRQRRCLVPADGFIEWQRTGSQKQPYLIEMKDHRVFAFAGLWQDDGFVIITTASNAVVARIHNRMPVILPPETYLRWLDPGTPLDELPPLAPFDANAMVATPISSRINRATYDDVACIAPQLPERRLFE